MYSGLGTLVFGPFISLGGGGKWLGVSCDKCLWLLEQLIAWGREIPYAYLGHPAPPSWLFALGRCGIAKVERACGMQ